MLNIVCQASRGQELVEVATEYAREDFLGHLANFGVGFLLLLGSGLILLASIGLIRLPDLPTRMHASTKAGSLGAGLVMLATAVAMPTPDVVTRAVVVVAFLLLTAPVAAHIIGRAGYFVGVPLWEGTVKDDLAEQYNYETHTLESGGFGDREVDGVDEASEPDEEDEELDPIVPEGQECYEERKPEYEEGPKTVAEEAREAEGEKAEEGGEVEEGEEGEEAEEVEEGGEVEEADVEDKKKRDGEALTADAE